MTDSEKISLGEKAIEDLYNAGYLYVDPSSAINQYNSQAPSFLKTLGDNIVMAGLDDSNYSSFISQVAVQTTPMGQTPSVDTWYSVIASMPASLNVIAPEVISKTVSDTGRAVGGLVLAGASLYVLYAVGTGLAVFLISKLFSSKASVLQNPRKKKSKK